MGEYIKMKHGGAGVRLGLGWGGGGESMGEYIKMKQGGGGVRLGLGLRCVCVGGGER